jgi:hypothetical protein
VRILHLIDPASPDGDGHTLRLLADLIAFAPDTAHTVLALGTRDHGDLARRCGLAAAGTISIPAEYHRVASHLVRQYVKRSHAAGLAFDHVMSWSLRAASIAQQALPAQPRSVYATTGPVDLRLGRRFMGSALRRPVQVFCASPEVYDAYRRLGIPMDELSLLEPALPLDDLQLADRAAARARWDIDDDVFAVGLLGQPITWSDAWYAANVLVRLCITGRPSVLITHPHAAARVHGRHWVDGFKRRIPMRCDDAVTRPWTILNGLDAVICTDVRTRGVATIPVPRGGWGDRPVCGTLPLRWAMATRTPLVAERAAAYESLIGVEDDASEVCVPITPHDVEHACRAIIAWHEDRATSDALTARAYAHLQARNDMHGFAETLRTHWHAMLRSPALVR